MGCPAKKICNVMAGSALLTDESLVGRILESVVNAVPETPVTLKIRTGWDKSSRNALSILKIAEQSGIRALAMHGRTRACGYSGQAEYETIAAVKREARIPIIANGDISSPEKAKYVLDATSADALMIGRAAQGDVYKRQVCRPAVSLGSGCPLGVDPTQLSTPDVASEQAKLAFTTEPIGTWRSSSEGSTEITGRVASMFTGTDWAPVELPAASLARHQTR